MQCRFLPHHFKKGGHPTVETSGICQGRPGQPGHLVACSGTRPPTATQQLLVLPADRRRSFDDLRKLQPVHTSPGDPAAPPLLRQRQPAAAARGSARRDAAAQPVQCAPEERRAGRPAPAAEKGTPACCRRAPLLCERPAASSGLNPGPMGIRSLMGSPQRVAQRPEAEALTGCCTPAPDGCWRLRCTEPC